MPKTVIRYTAAPRDYDDSYTTHIGIVGTTSTGKPVRKVHIEADRAAHQCGRYASGMYNPIDHVEFCKQVDSGFIRTAESWPVSTEELADFRLAFADTIDQLIEYRQHAERMVAERGGADLDADFQRGQITGVRVALSLLEQLETLLDKVDG